MRENVSFLIVCEVQLLIRKRSRFSTPMTHRAKEERSLSFRSALGTLLLVGSPLVSLVVQTVACRRFSAHDSLSALRLSIEQQSSALPGRRVWGWSHRYVADKWVSYSSLIILGHGEKKIPECPHNGCVLTSSGGIWNGGRMLISVQYRSKGCYKKKYS